MNRNRAQISFKIGSAIAFWTVVFENRSRFSLKMEWAVHNFLYKIHYKREQTKDVDLDDPCDHPEWIYEILGCLVWIFIR